MVEKLLADFLNIKYRQDFREQNKGNLIPIDCNLSFDRAYIRCIFKRKIVELNPKEIILINDKMDRTRINLNSTFKVPLNLTLNIDRNKIITLISNWIEAEQNQGHMPSHIELI